MAHYDPPFPKNLNWRDRVEDELHDAEDGFLHDYGKLAQERDALLESEGRLASAIAAMGRDLQRYEDALRFYADDENYKPSPLLKPVLLDHGAKARAALEEQ